MVQGKHDDGFLVLDLPGPKPARGSGGTAVFPAGTLNPVVLGDEDFQGYVQERTRCKLGRFSFHIQKLGIRMKGTTTPGGDAWVSCCLTIHLRQGEAMVIERSALMAREAFDHSLGVAERQVRRTLQKWRHRAA